MTPVCSRKRWPLDKNKSKIPAFGSRKNGLPKINPITEKHGRAESDTELHEALRLANVGSWRFDLQTGEVRVSEELYSITGLKKRDAVTRIEDHEKYYTPESWQRFISAADEARKTGKSYEIELEIIRPEGTRRHALSRGEAVTDQIGKVTALRGILQDITDRKQAEAELRKLKDELELQVAEKTRELKERVRDLERFHDATIDRELRMKELWDENQRLKAEKE